MIAYKIFMLDNNNNNVSILTEIFVKHPHLQQIDTFDNQLQKAIVRKISRRESKRG